MLKTTPAALCVALATVVVSAPLSAQSRSTTSSAAIEAAVTTRPAGDRAAVTAALTSSQAVAVAGNFGVSATELSDRVAALDNASVQQLNERILVGGANTVIISTTTIIIFLLLLILLTN